METKQEMKQRYKQMKSPMGAFIIRNNTSRKAWVDVSIDTKSMMNRMRFQLKHGSLPIKELQKDWKEYGEEAFSFEVLELLKYDEKGETKDDSYLLSPIEF